MSIKPGFLPIADNVRVKEDIWFLGDTFLKDTIDALFAMKKAAVIIKQPKPYIFNYFNISGHYVTTGSGIKGVAWLLNPLIHGLNEEPFLPKLIVVIPDIDMLKYLAINGKASSLVIGSTLHYAIMQFDLYIEKRKQDLASKCPGALIPDDTYPKIIWVRIPRRPKVIARDIFANRGRFNSIIEERLFDGKETSHFIISIEIPQDEFTLTGDLSSTGKASFWKEMNEGLKKFDKQEITLKPRQRNQPNQEVAKDQRKKEEMGKALNSNQRKRKSDGRINSNQSYHHGSRRDRRSHSRSHTRYYDSHRHRHHHRSPARSRSHSHRHWYKNNVLELSPPIN